MASLGANDIESFVARGYTLVRGAFSLATADEICDFLSARIDREQETRATVLLEETYTDGPFVRVISSGQLRSAIDELLGPRRWYFERDDSGRETVGWFPISFPGFPAAPNADEWHLDIDDMGQPDACLRLDLSQSPPRRQALVVMPLFSEIETTGGGTLLRVGSHRVTARILASHPGGIVGRELLDLARTHVTGEIVEVTGQPGDVALLHAWLLHARGPNASNRLRFVANMAATLTGPIDLTTPQTPFEHSIERSLHV